MSGARQRRSLSRHAVTNMRCVALLIAVLVAFCAHSLVTQTHLHFDAHTTPAALLTANDGNSHHVEHPGKASDSSTDCPLCQEQAVAGHYLAPSPFIFVAPVLLALWLFNPVLPGQVCEQRSHCWQSRAPPISS